MFSSNSNNGLSFSNTLNPDLDLYAHLSDQELRQLNDLLEGEMYEASEKSLYSFFINFWPTFDPSPLVNNWHLECLCEHAQAAADRQIRRLVVNIPPRSSKSTVNSIALPAYHLLKQPDEQFWLISHSERLFTQNIVYTRRIFDHPRYKDRWLDPNSPHYRFSITSDQNTKTRIDNNMGGRLMGGSPGTSALGMGYTIAVLDDILDSEESQNIAQVSKVNDWYSRTFLNRSNDNNNDVVIIVMQRLHSIDLTGYVKEKYADQDWFILNLPARYDSKRTFISPIGFNDKRTKERELLDPVRLSDAFLATQEKDPIVYETRYQQNPDLETTSQFYHSEYWRTTPFQNTSYTQRAIVWDLSFTDNPKSSYTVGLVLELAFGKYYIIDMFRKQCDTVEQIAAVERMHKKYPGSLTCVEIKANGHAVVNILSNKVPNIHRLDPKLYGGSKEQRFGAVIPFCKEGKVWFFEPKEGINKLESTYDLEIIKKELTGFPLYSSNDIVDTFAYGILVLNTFNNDSTVVVGAEKMKYTDEDFFGNRETSIYEVNNPINFYVDALPTRDDITGLQW